VTEDASSASGLRAFLDALPDVLEERLGTMSQAWRSLRSFVSDDGLRLARAMRTLTDPLCVFPESSDLGARRERLQRAVAGGESIVPRSAEAARYAEAILERYREQYVSWHLAAFGEARFAGYRRICDNPGWRVMEQLEKLPLAVPLVLDSIQALAEAEAARQCSSGGLQAALQRSPVCPCCRLPLGSEVSLMPMESIERRLMDGFQSRWAGLAEHLECIQKHLARRVEPGTSLHSRLETIVRLLLEGRVPDTRELAATVDDSLIRELKTALTAGEPSVRSLAHLDARLVGREVCRTDAFRIFTAWLDPGANLRPDEYVRVGE
jgi:hypothetical protein